MKPDPARTSAPRREEGIALVVVLLFTAVVLTIVVSTTATLALGARGGGVNERTAYQALLAAESGLNTFPVRVSERFRTAPYTANSASALTTWLQPLSTYGTAQLTFENVTAAGSGFKFDVVSAGTQSNASKSVLQTYTLYMGGLPLNFRPRAALTSLPEVNANGSAQVTGTANDGPITSVRGSSLTLAVNTSSIVLPVNDTTGVLVGDYVRVNGMTFRINEKTTDTLSLTPVGISLTSPLSLSGDVNLMLNAVASTHSTVSDPIEVKASNYGDFIVGESVTVSGQKALVTAVDSVTGRVKLDWIAGIPAKLDEGTQIFRDIKAMRSAREIDPKDNKLEDYAMRNTSGGSSTQDCSSANVCSGENDPLLQSTNDQFLTKMLLGLTDAELDAAIPLSSSLAPMNNEIRRISADRFDDLIKNGNSSGVLIVDGDINSNTNGNTVFNGFIYFRGNHGGKFNGNLTVNGAIAVRGGPIEGITSTDDVDTDITGNLTLNYDAVTLRRQMMISTGVPKITAEQGTWRQR